jgi:hypothetical protein
MSHHGNQKEQEEELRRAMRALTGEFPDGRLNEHDQGAIAVGIGHQEGRVTMQFPKNLNWIGFTADQAIDIANSLIEHARKAGSNKPLTVKIG